MPFSCKARQAPGLRLTSSARACAPRCARGVGSVNCNPVPSLTASARLPRPRAPAGAPRNLHAQALCFAMKLPQLTSPVAADGVEDDIDIAWASRRRNLVAPVGRTAVDQ